MVDEPRRYLLAVGVRDYDDDALLTLDGVPKELERIVTLLTNPPYRFERILFEASLAPHTEDLLTQLPKWAASPDRRPQDQLTIYWTGHGAVKNEELHLLLKDSTATPLTRTIRAKDLIENALPENRSASVLLLLDVCYSGHSAIDVGQRLGALIRTRTSRNMPEIAILAASRPREEAQQHAFAEAFLNALQQCEREAPEHEPQLYLHKLLERIGQLIPVSQTPGLFSHLNKVKFFANPRCEPDPAKRADAIGLMERVRRFEAEYLIGENSNPVPFGGRQTELGQLDNWLTDQRLDSRLVITALAGRGKSALLVRWIESLRSRGEINGTGWNLIFVPVSQRFLTSAPEIHFHLIALQLARIADERLERPATDPPGFYADQSRRLLNQLASSDKKILVVLDGLDEAFDQHVFSTIFPKVLPQTMRIVVSARQQMGDDGCKGWLHRLDWPSDGDHHLALQTLARNQIADVLIQMGAPVDIVATEPELVRRLAELTEGEPLTLRFYAEDLWKKAKGGVVISRADLDQMKPGLAPYIDRWFELQACQWDKEKQSFDLGNLDRVLSILSAARGPLHGEDLTALFCSTFPDVNCPPTSRQLLGPLRRFVIGDGQEMPYSLNHPKIGEVLKEGRCRELMPVVGSGFVNWGLQHVQSLNGGEIEPKNASAYALRFLRFHFENAKVPAATFMTLVEDGWRRAWEHIEGGPRGFSADVQAAWKAQRRNGLIENLGSQWRCALVLSSIKSLGRSMPSELVLSAVRKGAISVRQGQQFAEQMESDESSIETYAHLSLANIAKPALCVELFKAALERAQAANSDDRDRLMLILFDIVLAFDASNIPLPGTLLAEALAAASDIADEKYRAEALAALAPHLPETLLAEALAAASDIADEEYRTEALTGLAPHLPADQKAAAFAEALAAASDIANKQRRVKALAALAPHLPEALLAKALAAASDIADEWTRAEALAVLSSHLPEDQKATAIADSIVTALAATNNLSDEEYHTEALAVLAPHLPEALLAEAFVAASDIADEELRIEALIALAPHLPQVLLAEALAAAAALRHKEYRPGALAALAPHLPQDQKAAAFAEALAAAAAIGNERHRAKALAALASHLPKALFAEAIAAARGITDEEYRAETLAALAPHLPADQKAAALTAAHVAAAALTDEERRANALAALAPHLPTDQKAAAFAEALAAALADERRRAEALAALAPHLPEDQKAAAIAGARHLTDERARARALTALAPHLPEDQKAAAIAAAIAAATTIRDSGRRNKALAALALLLPEDQKVAAIAAANEGRRNEGLAVLAPHLPEALLVEALAAARAIADERARVTALTALAPHLSETLFEDFLYAVLETVPRLSRKDALCSLCNVLKIVAAVGGIPTLIDIKRAIKDVATWYP